MTDKYNRKCIMIYLKKNIKEDVCFSGGQRHEWAPQMYLSPLAPHFLGPCINSLQTTSDALDKMPCYRKDDRAMCPIAYMGGVNIFGRPWIAMPI